MRNQRLISSNAEHFDEVKGPKNLGRHQGPAAHGNRPSPMSAGPARPTQSVFGIPTHGTREENSTNGQLSRPLPSSRAQTRDLLRSWDSLLSSLRVIERSGHVMPEWPVRWRASMAAALHCHSSYYENPTLHIGVK